MFPRELALRCAERALGSVAISERRPPRARVCSPGHGLMTNILVLIFAIMLCLVNALVWTFISEMPVMGTCWALAAGLCFWLQKWSRR